MSNVKKLRQELRHIFEVNCETDLKNKLLSFLAKVKKARDEARDDFLRVKSLFEKNPSPELKGELRQKKAQSAEIRQLHQKIKTLLSFFKE